MLIPFMVGGSAKVAWYYNIAGLLAAAIVGALFGLLFGIPSNAPDADFSAFMLEALSHESYTTTLPAYIEISAKVKHVYDEKSAQILDLIFDSVNYDFGFLYGIGGLNQILMAKIPQAGKNNFASLYASSEAKAQTELEKLLTTVAELE